MESKLTETQSLSLISEMIEQARNNFQKGAGTSFIFYGIMVSFTAILNIVLLYMLPAPRQAFWIWLLMFPASIAGQLIDRKVRKQALVITHIDKIISATWNGFLVSVILYLMLVFGYAITTKGYGLYLSITPMILVMCGAAEFITAKACRYKPVLTGALVMWAGALLCLITYISGLGMSGVTHFIILAVCMILGFVIPGYKMNKTAKEHV